MSDKYDTSAAKEIQPHLTQMSEKVKVKVKPQVPLAELAAPLLAKWAK